MPLGPDDVVLFQGDSVTDCGRRRGDPAPNDPAALGGGYAGIAALRLLADHPGIAVHNRGVSGNKITDLQARWRADALNLNPTVLSVLIGVNDTWHGVAVGEPHRGTILVDFDRRYRELLADTKEALPGVRLVVCEPFVLEAGAVLEQNFHPDLDERQEIVRAIAADHADAFVPFQSVVNAALTRAEPAYWAADGVHPSPAGHRVMADAWLEAVESL